MRQRDDEVVYTHMGARYRYDVIRRKDSFLGLTSYKFYVYREAEKRRGPFERLDDAVKAADKEP